MRDLPRCNRNPDLRKTMAARIISLLNMAGNENVVFCSSQFSSRGRRLLTHDSFTIFSVAFALNGDCRIVRSARTPSSPASAWFAWLASVWRGVCTALGWTSTQIGARRHAGRRACLPGCAPRTPNRTRRLLAHANVVATTWIRVARFSTADCERNIDVNAIRWHCCVLAGRCPVGPPPRTTSTRSWVLRRLRRWVSTELAVRHLHAHDAIRCQHGRESYVPLSSFHQPECTELPFHRCTRHTHSSRRSARSGTMLRDHDGPSPHCRARLPFSCDGPRCLHRLYSHRFQSSASVAWVKAGRAERLLDSPSD